METINVKIVNKSPNQLPAYGIQKINELTK